MRPSLLDAPDEAILARVAIALVKRRLRLWHETATEPATLIRATTRALPPDGFSFLRFAMHSLAAHVSLGVSSQDWLSGVTERALYGGVFRWVFFSAYKQNRNPYPPVSNTGVQNVAGPRRNARRKAPSSV